MDATINALGGILLNAVPTVLLLIFLHFYLKSVFFRPLEKLLRQRDEETTGARRKAEESLAKAEEKTAQYEETLRQARSEIYKDQEELRKQWKAEQDAQVAQAAAQSKATVQAAKDALAVEVAAARSTLENDARVLASRIADSVLNRKVA